jgi:hypothetical protein
MGGGHSGDRHDHKPAGGWPPRRRAPSADDGAVAGLLGDPADERVNLLLALAATGYIAVGTAFEERDLRRTFGVSYHDYAARVPALVPRLRVKI